MSHVRLVDLEKRFGNSVAVDSINLSIESGEFVVLLGPSGCGKTTTLRMVAGLEEVTSGRIFIGDQDVAHVHARDRNVAMVFQSYALYPHMSVRENLDFALRLRKISVPTIAQRVKDVSTMLGIEKLLDRKPRNLSGGQQQRVALGRALIRNPAVFLFDEPLSNLDAKLRSEMRLEIIQLHQKIDTTMIYVTHDQVEAMTMADRIVVMSQGRIQQIGTPLEIYDDPVNLFVAGFIGSPSMNMFDASIENCDGIEIVSGAMRIPVSNSHPVTGHSAAKIGIRPESIAIHPPGERAGVDAVVESIEHLGAETLFVVSTGGPTLTIKSPRNNSLKRGDRICVNVCEENVFGFNANDGNRIRASL
jgi:ABC-type sugar transport system ATPase subunit